jgi:hypothetical protein
VNCKFAQEVKILSRRAVEPFEVGLTKQLLCKVDPNAGRIGALLIRRVANRFLRQIGRELLSKLTVHFRLVTTLRLLRTKNHP